VPTDNEIQADERFIFATRQQEAGDFITAKRLYEELLVIYPRNFELLQRIGCVLVQLGRIEESIGHLKHAISLQPGNAMAYYGLAMALDRDGDEEAALDSLQQALICDPNFALAHAAISEINFP
jgi:tetratricopeptide (TPR) repeat protein